MKQIIRNRYVKAFTFSSFQERKEFLNNQVAKNILSVDETFGDNHLCYVCYDSLTKEKQFVLSFDSDESESNLNFLFWHDHNIYVLETGKRIYFLDEYLNTVVFFEITTPLVGLHLLDVNTLLLLEEAYFRVVDFKGKLLKSGAFDLISDFKIENGKLFIQTNESSQSFVLY